jgi:tetraacyldisaccharide 4'-kinase
LRSATPMRAPEFWHEPPGLAAGLLAPIGAAWDIAARLRRAVARPYRAPMPVLCVGNLVAGGSGKTPIVLALAELFGERGIAVHVVSRGYGGELSGRVRVAPGLHDAAAVGDEALLIAARAPCWVARDRASGVAAAAEAGAAIVLLDDGFQNPSVAKDLSLVVVDAEYGFGNGRVIPAGPLREPIAAGLARADGIVLIGDAPPPRELNAVSCPILRAVQEPVNGERFTDGRLAAFAGIGRPEKFFATLRRLGATLVAAQSFADHHPFRADEIARLRETAAHEDARLVTTAKDWVRLSPELREGIEVLDIEIRWRDSAMLHRLLSDFLQRAGDGRDARAAHG